MGKPIDYFSTGSLSRDLKGKTVRGGLVTGISQGLSIAIGLLAVPMLARLLDPDDFGLVAMVAVITGFATMFVDAGLSMATVQREDINHRQVSNLFWIASALGVFIALIVAALSPVISWFYEEPQLVAITLALSFSFVLSGLNVQHQALLRRGMQFTHLAVINVSSIIAGQAAGILWAWHYFGQPRDYWALVWIPIVTAATRLLLTWMACPWRPGLPRRGAGSRELLTFGANLTGYSFVNYFARNGDKLLIGWWWGTTPLGFYERAFKLFFFPLQAINGPASGVIIPGLSRIVDFPAKYRKNFLQIFRMLLTVTVPVGMYCAVCAPTIVAVVLGPNWSEAADLLQIMGGLGAFQSAYNSCGWLFITQARVASLFRWGILNSTIIVLAFAAGLPWGAYGVALAYGIAFNCFSIPTMFYTAGRAGPVSTADLWQSLLVPVVLGLSTSLPCYFVQDALFPDNAMLCIAATSLILLIGIVATLLFSNRAESRTFFQLVTKPRA